MALFSIGRGGAAVTLGLLLQASAFAQGTEHEREACTPDVFRLCGAYIPDPDRITACLQASGPQLSPACYDVIYPPQDMPPARPPGQRKRSNSPPPARDN